MAWRGFLAESRVWMDYPACGRWRFWRQFPFAAARFYWMTIRDTISFAWIRMISKKEEIPNE